MFPVTLHGREVAIGDGSIVIAAITSCTNTSNPFVLLGAGLVANDIVGAGRLLLAGGDHQKVEELDRLLVPPDPGEEIAGLVQDREVPRVPVYKTLELLGRLREAALADQALRRLQDLAAIHRE